MRRALGFLLAGGAVALSAWWLWPAAAPLAPSMPAKAAGGAFAPSQQGTQPDGQVGVAASGALRVDAELRRLFDYYLAALGEHSLPAIRAELQRYLQGKLKAAALSQAMNLFDRYVAYRQSLAGMTVAAQTDLAQRLGRAQAVRRQYFNEAELAGLFGDEDRYDDFTAKRLAILANPSLSAAEKQRQVAELERQLPPALRAAREEPIKPLTLAQAESALQKNGGDEQALYSLRAGMVGQAAADRLSELDKEQASWQARVADFKRDRAAIASNSQLTAQQQQQAVAQLQAQRFNAQEALRLPAFAASP
ncbi:lipase secretion chaperone [Chromobacterium sp. IIBBL 290-4]|uniref:lipase secretion chaperone n=1 Tax=Chromobacterium sp. IIBBL 290-4 TaxID=2953890 RepID=UPI0020B78454|nr:lipase secretion chaperone [Chromobacterium sp. IIBBL 290-4]UTH73771.1 hypothetical protein NKT35_19845 [Chromobacterium sp. IIBBL 290-4]